MADFGTKTEHPSYGMIGISRVSSTGSRLFDVDYPQGNYITLTIKSAVLYEDGGQRRIFADKEMIRIEMSEVQYARMISSPNMGDGVPCTLSRYVNTSGSYIQVEDPPAEVSRSEAYKAEVAADAAVASKRVKDAMAKLDAVLGSGVALRKRDLHEVREALRMAAQDIDCNLPYLIERAQETIHKSAENAKMEVNAHIDFALLRLGERALGDRLNAAIEAGVNPSDVGQSVMRALAPPEKPDA